MPLPRLKVAAAAGNPGTGEYGDSPASTSSFVQALGDVGGLRGAGTPVGLAARTAAWTGPRKPKLTMVFYLVLSLELVALVEDSEERRFLAIGMAARNLLG